MSFTITTAIFVPAVKELFPPPHRPKIALLPSTRHHWLQATCFCVCVCVWYSVCLDSLDLSLHLDFGTVSNWPKGELVWREGSCPGMQKVVLQLLIYLFPHHPDFFHVCCILFFFLDSLSWLHFSACGTKSCFNHLSASSKTQTSVQGLRSWFTVVDKLCKCTFCCLSQ